MVLGACGNFSSLQESSWKWKNLCGLQGGGVFLGACRKLLIFAGKQLEVEELMWLFLLFKLSYVHSDGNFMIFTWGDLELFSVEQKWVL